MLNFEEKLQQTLAARAKLEKNLALLEQIDQKIENLQKQRKLLKDKIAKQEGFFEKFGKSKKLAKALEAKQIMEKIQWTKD
jgi:hypothetical protein